MKKKSPAIVFFGSGPVAAASLAFLAAHFPIEAVVTKPVTIHQMSSAAPDVTIYTVSNERELTTLVKDTAFQSSLGVVVDFGIIMEQSVIDSFPLGILNSHFSLLPEWRGADPITFAILSGQTETGVSLMLIDEKLDEGNLIAQESLNILPSLTTPGLTQQLIELSNDMLLKHIPSYISGETKPYSQDLSKPITYSRKLTKDDGIIDWNKPAVDIERQIRAFADWPRSRTKFADKDVIITKATVTDESGSPGTIRASKNQLIVFCSQQALNIHRVQPAGKKEMPIQAFLAGNKL